jgi:PhnB protein
MIAEKSANDDAQIRRLKDEMTNAIRSKNSDGVVSQFADKSVMFVLAPPLRFKTGENAPGENGIQEWFDTFEGEIGYEFRELEITSGEAVAFCHSLDHISGKRTDGTDTDTWVRETLGLRKIEGEWKITHQHQSVPMYMDGSNKAAVDLKP